MSDSDDESDIEDMGLSAGTPTDPWYPHGSKVMFLLDMMTSMPRLRLSTDHIKFILWILKELNVSNVPSFKAFRKKQAELNRQMPIHTVLKHSPRGPVFFQNHIGDLLALDWANPETRAHLEEYPVRSTHISESCHSDKWVRETPAEKQAPMWANGSQHFFIGELAQLDDLRLVVPLAWYRKRCGGEVFCEARQVAWVDCQPRCMSIQLVDIPASQLIANVHDLAAREVLLSDHVGPLPAGIYPTANPLREVARGRRMYTSFVKIWVDDVSGNRSKQYNEHANVYFAHANLPHQKLAQEYFIGFCSTSNYASPGDQMNAVIKDVQSPRWKQAFDCAVQEEILYQVIPLFEPADNPQQSESCSHMGLKGNLWCRRCKLGGPERVRETDDMYEQHFTMAARDTVSIVREQLDLAAWGMGTQVQHLQRSTGVKDQLAERWIQQVLLRAREEHQARIPTSGASSQEIKREIHDELITWLWTQPASSYAALASDSPMRHQLRAGDHYVAQVPAAERREAAETLAMVKHQLDLAAWGVAKKVQEHQTRTGVKDQLAEYWIEQLLARAQQEHQLRIYNTATRDGRLNVARVVNRAEIVIEIKKSVHDELMLWLHTQPERSYAALDAHSPLRDELRAGDHYNALLELEDCNIHDDTPVEILHTYLLGMSKYAWHFTNLPWTSKQCESFATRLQSSSTMGLSIPPLRAAYIVQYRNGLIGKHFKALQQLAIFHLDSSLCDPLGLDLWKATGELGAYIWFHEIENMELYLNDLAILIGNLLDIWSLIDPRRIFVKPKLHILTHILEDIRRHGPAGLYATEIFECFNAVFRLCSVLSNRQAPSRDIALAIAGLTRFKYQVSGTWWQESKGSYVQAGPSVRQYFRSAELQRRLGFVQREKIVPGQVRHKGSSVAVSWTSLNVNALDCGSRGHCEWRPCVSVVAQHGDACPLGAWVFVDCGGVTQIGRIKFIGRPEGNTAEMRPCVILERFKVLDQRHAFFQMPQLVRADGEKHMVIEATNVLFIVNAQHNCRDGKCNTTGSRRRWQERQETDLTEIFVEHQDDDDFILNMHALHNAALIRKILPRALTAPVAYVEDRVATHKKMAASLRQMQEAKREKEAKARKERGVAKAAQKAAAVAAAAEPADADGGQVDDNCDSPDGAPSGRVECE